MRLTPWSSPGPPWPYHGGRPMEAQEGPTADSTLVAGADPGLWRKGAQASILSPSLGLSLLGGVGGGGDSPPGSLP